MFKTLAITVIVAVAHAANLEWGNAYGTRSYGGYGGGYGQVSGYGGRSYGTVGRYGYAGNGGYGGHGGYSTSYGTTSYGGYNGLGGYGAGLGGYGVNSTAGLGGYGVTSTISTTKTIVPVAKTVTTTTGCLAKPTRKSRVNPR